MRRIVLVILCAILPCLGSAVQLVGAVPPGLDALFLTTRYFSIWNKLAPDTPPDPKPIQIIYYRKSDTRHTGVRLPEWGGGGAIGRDTIIIPIDRAPLLDMNLDQITIHELVHIVISRRYGHIHIPRWFHEGMAMFLSGEMFMEEQVALSRAVFTNSMISLDSIEFVNRFDAVKANVAYSQSHLGVKFLVDTYGLDMLPELLHSVDSLHSFNNAMVATIGLTQKELEQLLRSYLFTKYKYFFLLSDDYLAWLLIAVLAFVAFIVKVLRDQKKRKQLGEVEEEEIIDDEYRDLLEWNDKQVEDGCKGDGRSVDK